MFIVLRCDRVGHISRLSMLDGTRYHTTWYCHSANQLVTGEVTVNKQCKTVPAIVISSCSFILFSYFFCLRKKKIINVCVVFAVRILLFDRCFWVYARCSIESTKISHSPSAALNWSDSTAAVGDM